MLRFASCIGQETTMLSRRSSSPQFNSDKKKRGVIISLARAHDKGHTSLVYCLEIVCDREKSARVLGDPFRLYNRDGKYVWTNKELRANNIKDGSIISYKSRRFLRNTKKKLEASQVLSLLHFQESGGVVYPSVKEAFPNARISDNWCIYNITRPDPPYALVSISFAVIVDGRIVFNTQSGEQVNLSNRSVSHMPKPTEQLTLSVQDPPSEDVGVVLLITFGSNPTNGNIFNAVCGGIFCEEPSDTPKLERYPMSRNPRGLCIMINNLEFQNKSDNRKGGEIDEEMLGSLFTDLSFEVDVRHDLKYNEIMDTAEEYASKDHTDYDAFVMIVMTHGGDGDAICGVNGKTISVKALMAEFKAARCPSLKNKPKIFIFQTCRRSNTNMLPTDGCNKRFKADAFSPDSTLPLSVTPPEADFLLAFATSPGYYSWRDEESGSLYIQVLVQVIRELHQHYHLLDMLTEVNNRVAKRAGNEVDSEDIQMPAPVHTLRAQLYLCKIFEEAIR